MSTDIGMKECCISGTVNEGTPTGTVSEIDSLPTYIASPTSGSKSKTLIFISDIFGWEFKNARLLADEYAKAGFYVLLPDFLQGDAFDISFLQSVEPPLKVREQLTLVEKTSKGAIVGTQLPPWLLKHREAVMKPLISSYISAVRATSGVSKIGTIGFCWGGRYTILTAHGEVDAAYACHPSTVVIPGDFEGVTKPLSLAIGEKDSLLDQKSVGQIQEILGKKTDVPKEIRIYEDQVHGFSIRSDWSMDKDKKAMDDSLQQGVDWFSKYLA